MKDKRWLPIWARNLRRPSHDVEWKFPVDIYASSTIESLKIFQLQSEKYLDDTLKIAESIASRSTTLITLTSAIVITTLTYGVQNNTDIRMMTLAFITSLYCWLCLIVLVWYGVNGRYKSSGFRPEHLVYTEFFEEDNIYREKQESDKFKDKNLYIYIIEELQYRCSCNVYENWRRWHVVNFTTFALAMLPLILAVIYYFMS